MSDSADGEERDYQPGDVVMLLKAHHWQNHMRVGQIVQHLPRLYDEETGIWWLCEFPRPVKTDVGWMYFACLRNEDVRRVGLKVPRFHYPSYHYALLPRLAEALSSTREFRNASA